MKRLVLACALAACGQAQEGPCREHRCDAVPLAFEATDPVVEEVVRDLRQATGADVITDPMGVPVIFEPETIHPQTGKRQCGYTVMQWQGADMLYQEIHVATEATEGCGTLWHVVAHEMIHALAPFSDHTPDGLFAGASNDMQRFDEAAIDVLCAAVSCER